MACGLAATMLFGGNGLTALAAGPDQAVSDDQTESRQTFTENGIAYTVLSNDTVAIGDGQKAIGVSDAEFTVPSSVSHAGRTYRVTAVADNAFMDNTSTTKVSLPEGITSIGSNAFLRAGVEHINLPKSLTAIGRSAFWASSLTEVTIPGSVKEISAEAFCSTEKLTSVTMEDGVQSIGDRAFSSCTSLTSIRIPDSVTSIGEQAFFSTTLSSIDLGNGLKSIGKNAFQFAENLTSVKIPASIESIGDHAFSSCSRLESTGLEDTESHLKKIGSSAFSSTKIHSITIPASCTSIGDGAFSGADSMTEFKVSEKSRTYKSINGVLYSADGKKLIRYPANKSGSSFTTPDGVETIESYAFQGVKKLHELTLSDSVKTVSDFAAQSATGLETVTMGKGVKTIGRLAFQKCTGLTEITLSEGLETVSDNAFYGCTSLESLTLPKSTTSIGTGIVSGCESLTDITVNADSLKSLDKNAFSGISDSVRFHTDTNAVKKQLKDTCGIADKNITSDGNDPITAPESFKADGVTYKVESAPTKGADGKMQPGTVLYGSGSGYNMSASGEVTVPETVTDPDSGYSYTVVGLNDSAFYYSYNMTGVTLPSTIKTIGKNAFASDFSLESVNFGKNSQLESIGENAFNGCSALKSLTLPKNLKTIGDGALPTSLESIAVEEGNTAFTAIDGVLFGNGGKTLLIYPAGKKGTHYEVPDGTTAIAAGAFDGNSRLGELTVPKSVKTIGEKAFSGTQLTSIDIQGAESIGEMAFYRSSKLTEVRLPETLKEIPKYAFYNCWDLSEITFPQGVVKFDKGAMDGSSFSTIRIEASDFTSSKMTFEDGSVNTDAKYSVATQEIKDKLIKAGVDADNITVDDSLKKEAPKLKTFTINHITYEVTKDPEGSEAGTVMVQSAKDASGDVRIPETVSGDETNGYTYQVTEIGKSAFYMADQITSIEVPASVEKIGVNGINANAGLKTITFAKGSRLHTLENGALADNHALTSIVIPKSVKTMGTYVLGWDYGLESVAFEDGFSMDALPDGFVFRDGALKDFTIPDSVKTLGDEVFYNCAALPSVNLKNITAIGANAFQGCSSLKEVTLPDAVTEISDGTFANCTSLEKITLGKNMTSIGTGTRDAEGGLTGTFENDTALKKISIPEGVTQIPDRAFAGCTNLKDITLLAHKLDGIGANAFLNISRDAGFTVYDSAAAKAVKDIVKIDGKSVTDQQITVLHKDSRPGTGGNTEDQTGGNTKDNTGKNTGGNTGKNTENTGKESRARVEYIDIAAAPARTVYEKGEAFDFRGGELLVGYTDGTEKTIPMTEAGVRVVGYNANKAGFQTVFIYYKGKSTPVDVTVREKTVTPAKKTKFYKITVKAKKGGKVRLASGKYKTKTSKTYKKGKTVRLTAKAKRGWKFVKWTSGGKKISGKKSLKVKVTKKATYTAVFRSVRK